VTKEESYHHFPLLKKMAFVCHRLKRKAAIDRPICLISNTRVEKRLAAKRKFFIQMTDAIFRKVKTLKIGFDFLLVVLKFIR